MSKLLDKMFFEKNKTVSEAIEEWSFLQAVFAGVFFVGVMNYIPLDFPKYLPLAVGFIGVVLPLFAVLYLKKTTKVGGE